MLQGVRHNPSAWAAYRALVVHEGDRSLAAARLASGMRIASAADDAAGLAISEGLRSVVGGTRMAIRNIADGVSMLRTAEAALGSTQSIAQRMRDLAVQRGSADVLGPDAVAAIDTELSSLRAEIGRILESTTWGSRSLLDGSAFSLQVGAAAGDSVTVAIPGLEALRTFAGRGAAAAPAPIEPAPEADPVLTATYTEATNKSVSSQRIADLDLADAASFDRLNGTVSYQGASLDLATVTFAAGSDASTRLAALQSALDSALGTGAVTVTADGASALLSGRDQAAGNGRAAKDAVAVGFTPAAAPAPTGETNPPLSATYAQASRTTVSTQTVAGLDLTDAASFDRLNGTIGYQGATLDLYTVEFGADDDAATRLATLQGALDAALGAGAVTVSASGGDTVFAGRDAAANNSGAARDAVAVTFAQAAGPTPVKGESGDPVAEPGPVVDPGSLIAQLDEVLSLITGARAYLGATENRLEHTMNVQHATLEASMAAESRIRDADQAYEVSRLLRAQIGSEIATAMLAQATRTPEQLVSLLT